MRGILDRMDRNNKGELVIVDYKSGKAPLAKYKEPRFFALKLYALLIQKELGEMPSELKLIYLKNSTIHTLKVTQDSLDQVKIEVLEIWNNIKKAFETNEFPATKNSLCDWCYYKPICPVFNENAPDTEKLREINDELIEIKEQIEALEMFENINELPENSELGSIDNDELEKKFQMLDAEREDLEENIQKLLRK